MHESLQLPQSSMQPQFAEAGEWFAIQTKPRHEKKVASELEEKGLTAFLPLYTTLHQWSDRKQQVQMPLFANYVFVQIAVDRVSRTMVLQTNGVKSFVGMRGTGVSIPDEEVEAIQTLLSERVPFRTHPFLSVGQKVRIRGGSLDGLNGILVSATEGRSLVVSIDCIQRSLAISIDGYEVEAA